MQSVRGAQRKRNGSMRKGRSGGINQDWWSRRLGLRKDIWTRIERVSCQLGEEWSMEHSGQRQQPIRRWARDAFMWSNTHTHVCTHADTHTCTAVELEHRGRKGAELADWTGIWSQVFRSSDRPGACEEASQEAGRPGSNQKSQEGGRGEGSEGKGQSPIRQPNRRSAPGPPATPVKCCYACQPSGMARPSTPQPSPARIPFRSVLWCIQREFEPSLHFNHLICCSRPDKEGRKAAWPSPLPEAGAGQGLGKGQAEPWSLFWLSPDLTFHLHIQLLS